MVKQRNNSVVTIPSLYVKGMILEKLVTILLNLGFSIVEW